MDSAKERWLKGVPADKQASLIPAGWFREADQRDAGRTGDMHSLTKSVHSRTKSPHSLTKSVHFGGTTIAASTVLRRGH
jgi:hypothetical protein